MISNINTWSQTQDGGRLRCVGADVRPAPICAAIATSVMGTTVPAADHTIAVRPYAFDLPGDRSWRPPV